MDALETAYAYFIGGFLAICLIHTIWEAAKETWQEDDS